MSIIDQFKILIEEKIPGTSVDVPKKPAGHSSGALAESVVDKLFKHKDYYTSQGHWLSAIKSENRIKPVHQELFKNTWERLLKGDAEPRQNDLADRVIDMERIPAFIDIKGCRIKRRKSTSGHKCSRRNSNPGNTISFDRILEYCETCLQHGYLAPIHYTVLHYDYVPKPSGGGRVIFQQATVVNIFSIDPTSSSIRVNPCCSQLQVDFLKALNSPFSGTLLQWYLSLSDRIEEKREQKVKLDKLKIQKQKDNSRYWRRVADDIAA